MNIWLECDGAKFIKKVDITGWRLVEAQYISATRKLVDTLAEHEILETLIDSVKPHPLYQNEEFKGLHYLLFSPFRYPPLLYGSRFGKRTEPSLWYGSLQLSTALAETAFYRFNFIRASQAEFGIVETFHTAFAAHIKTSFAVDLTQYPFAKYRHEISSSTSYRVSQDLGASMRNDKIEMITYTSARDPLREKNIALFTPKAFEAKQPVKNSFHTWHCMASQYSVEFIQPSSETKTYVTYDIDTFMVDGCLPDPAG